MIEEGVMTVRENVHHVIEMLQEDRLDHVLDYLAELSEPDEPLSAETLVGIREGLDHFRNTPMSHREFLANRAGRKALTP